LPNIEINNKNTFTKCDVVFICSYGMDECFLEFIKAAAYFPEYTFGITGSYHRAVASGHIMPEAIPINLRLTGFLNENEYISLLGSASVIVVITTQENTLNCGAYEAVALGKPMILGDTDAIRSYFNKGSVYVNGSVESFCLGLEQTFRNLEMLRRDVICLKYELESDWNCRFKNFIETINRESGIKM
jgi:glycosyltransferase involved in cell wall biosynthesis